MSSTTSGSASPPQGTSSSQPFNPNQTASSQQRRYFIFDKAERETLLYSWAEDDHTRNALNVIFSSQPWVNQTGELDRFQLQALLEVQHDPLGEILRCRLRDCDYENRESTNAVDHLRVHFGNRPYLCTECDRAFTRRHDLKTHLTTHSRAQEFTCGYCDATFTRPSNRDRHVRSAHPDQADQEAQ